MFSQLRGWEWLIIVALILLLFGAKRLPDAARGLGRSLRIFKAETKGLADDATKDASGKAAGTAVPDAVTAAPPEALPAAGQAPPAAPAAADAPAPERTDG
ncbi:MAG: Sec-independent protein translocase subunit TatA [Candidatus Nanopelagicales bacterium]